MPAHLSFLEDATARFIAAFEIYQRLTDEKVEDIGAAAACVRELYLALEKGLKHALQAIDPYLLLQKPDRLLLRNLRRDISARTVPSIFCARTPFETIGLLDVWEVLQDVATAEVDEAVRDEFGRGLSRLRDTRNRAQHGELYEDVDGLLAVVEQVLGRFADVATVFAPDWTRELYRRNAHLQSRLRGIGLQIDGGWQVLLDHLQSSEHLDLSTGVYVITPQDEAFITFLIGRGEDGQGADLLGEAKGLPASHAGGFFTRFLSPDESVPRFGTTVDSEDLVGGLAMWAARKVGDQSAPTPKVKTKALLPLEAGTIRVPAAGGWLKLRFAGQTPSKLYLSTILRDFVVNFPGPPEVEGRASGVLESAVVRGTTQPDRVVLTGRAFLESEYTKDADEKEGAHTSRYIRVELEMRREASPGVKPPVHGTVAAS
jgi:hypothetical protein